MPNHTKLSVLIPSCRPESLFKFLDSLEINAYDPEAIELSLTEENQLSYYGKWGKVRSTAVWHGEYNVNQLTELIYKQSTSPYIFLAGDDTICHTKHWDKYFITLLDYFPDRVALVYPNDLMFGQYFAVYPVTTRLIMDSVKWPVPYKRYCVDNEIFEIVPVNRRMYLPNVVMEHLHFTDIKPEYGFPYVRDGKQLWYPQDKVAIEEDYVLLNQEIPRILQVREGLAQQCVSKLLVPPK